ncbi:MAG: NUDIX domain-containing protein [Marinilabiliaceae bacterium]|nr:NUDIX domain-containing protein [Marinilabiliaceae bacterium]
MYKVFFKDRTLFLTDTIERDLASDFNALHKYTTPVELAQFIERFEQNDQLQVGYIYGKNLDFILREVKSCFTFIIAAGGLVFNEQGDFLAIHRLGVYDLPKGKCEKGESIRQTAIREVEEECGIHNLILKQKLISTFHTYQLKGVSILKETVWFKMSYAGHEELKPQLEENIKNAEWFSKDKAALFAENTYPSIIEVLNKGNLIS